MEGRLSLAEIQQELVSARNRRGWGRYHSPENLAAAIASEAGELLHLFRWCPQEPPPPTDRVSDELADVLIFALHLAERCGINLELAVTEKMSRNRERFDT